jgi:hypothetical protein
VTPWQDPITDTATELAKTKDYTVEGLLVAITVLALMALVWMTRLYIRQRDRDETRYQTFTEKMLPILTTFKDTTAELKDLIREWLRAQPPGRAP